MIIRNMSTFLDIVVSFPPHFLRAVCSLLSLLSVAVQAFSRERWWWGGDGDSASGAMLETQSRWILLPSQVLTLLEEQQNLLLPLVLGMFTQPKGFEWWKAWQPLSSSTSQQVVPLKNNQLCKRLSENFPPVDLCGWISSASFLF